MISLEAASAGFLLAASVLIKPLAFPAVAYLLFRRRRPEE